MANHYYTENNTILCKQKHKDLIKATARFSYKIGDKDNCKNCDRILIEHGKQSENKCVSFEKLGYKYCGKVYFRGGERVAFEKVLSKAI